MIIKHIREYKNHHTDGVLLINGGFFCHTLEDIGRPSGIKIPRETCIPEGTYSVIITHSPRWDKPMLELVNVFPSDAKHIEKDGVVFTGVRPHGGNTIEHSEGCPIVAYNTDNKGKVWGSASGALFEIVKEALDKGEPVTWHISHVR